MSIKAAVLFAGAILAHPPADGQVIAAEGKPVSEDHRRRVREELAVPAYLDFRQIRDPAFDAKMKAGE